MVKVKLFGIFRLNTGLKELTVNAKTVNDIYPILVEEAKKINAYSTIKVKDLVGSIVVVNNIPADNSSSLKDGDEVMLMSPVCGGLI